MTDNPIEIIKKIPYYRHVDGQMLEKMFPATSATIPDWGKWKDNIPSYCEKEKVFLDMAQREQGMTFAQSVKKLGPRLNKKWVSFVETNMETIENLLETNKHYLIIPRMEFWEIILNNIHPDETVLYFFLRLATEYHIDNDWETTTLCFRDLLTGKILLGKEEKMCFVKGSLVWTNHGMIPIEDIQEGDRVATHNGRFSKVLKKWANEKGDRPLFHVYTENGKAATATEDHPFLVFSMEYRKIVWKKVSDLTRDDYLMRSSLVERKSCADSPYFRDYPSFHQFLHTHPRTAGAHVSMVHNKKSILGEGNGNNYTDLFSSADTRKKIWEWVMETNQHLFIKGWMDIFQSKTYFNEREEANLVAMVLNLFQYDMIVVESSCQWCMRPRRKVRCFRKNAAILVGDKKFIRFSHRKKERTHHSLVYTLHVENDHSFTVNGYVVKNCMGLTPDTMIMKENEIVPISVLKKGSVILDKDLRPVSVKNVYKTPYNGVIISSYAPHTLLYTKSQEKCPAFRIKDPLQPNLSYYYNPDVDKIMETRLNFVLKYLTGWDVKEITQGWLQWPISHSDQLLLQPIKSFFHAFQYKNHQHEISFQKDVLEDFIDQCIHNLLFISTDKLKHFFCYLERETNNSCPSRLTHKQALRCNHTKSILRTMCPLNKYDYMGEIYDIELEEGNSFCTTQTIVQKNVKKEITSWEQQENIPYIYTPDTFFQKINMFNGECDNGRQASDIWDDILHSQIQTGQPSLICIDRNKDECVSGDTRILTRNGVIPISSKKDEIVSVWNGTHFIDVYITRTGDEKRFIKVHFSNGMCLTCTPYHKFFLAKEQKKINASDIKYGDRLASFYLPSISSMDVIPSSIIMTLEWIAKRCVYTEKYVFIFDRDMESLRDILLDLQYCGLKSDISYNSYRNEYELRMDKARWNLINHRHFNKNTTYIEGDWVDDLQVVKIEESQTYQGSYCFHEPFSGTAIFEGVATGQCENIPDTHHAHGRIDLSSFLATNPLKKNLSKHRVIVYTTHNCPFFPLLQKEYDILEWKNIALCQEEWDTKRHLHALSSVPAIFLDNTYVGDFVDFWNHYLCPVFDFDHCRSTVRHLCEILDHSAENVPNRPILLDIYGMMDVLVRMRLSLDEAKSRQLQILMFQTIYHSSLSTSNEMSIQKGPCVNSKKIITLLDPNQRNDPLLWQNIMSHGLRNRIYLRTLQDEDEKPILCRFYECMKHDFDNETLEHVFKTNSVQDIDIPSYLKKIYRNEYELPQRERLWSMIKRKAYHIMDDTFHLYIGGQINKEALSELEQQAWSAGFHTIQIHKKKELIHP